MEGMYRRILIWNKKGEELFSYNLPQVYRYLRHREIYVETCKFSGEVSHVAHNPCSTIDSFDFRTHSSLKYKASCIQ